jgi:esterase
MAINLHHSALQVEKRQAPAVVLLHGLFGMASNLGALARSLSEHYRVYSVDLPNHGKSDWLEPFNIPNVADCVGQWMTQQNLAHAHFVGHSLGGKVAMQLALHHSARVDSLSIADIAPVPYPRHHDDVLCALTAVASAKCQSRSEAADVMAQTLEEESLIQFILMIISRDSQGIYRWRFNLQGIIEHYDAIGAGLEADAPFNSSVLFIKGGDSDYILPEHRGAISHLFPSAAVKIMPGCGHWLHAQRPAMFNGIVRRFLAEQGAD